MGVAPPNKIELDELDSQFVWYAKSWFELGDLMSHLKALTAKRNGIELKHVNDWDTIAALYDICLTCNCRERLSDFGFFLRVVFGSNYSGTMADDRRSTVERACMAMLNVLSNLKMAGIALSAIDPNVIPLRKIQ